MLFLFAHWLHWLLVPVSKSFNSGKTRLTKITALDRSGRIVGGWFAFPELLPHQVSLKDTTSRLHFCGGFIISERWVGSAAGCTLNRTPENTIILAGTTSLSFGGSTYQVTQIINHEGYFPELRVNDVSLLQTAVPFTYSASIAPIALTVNLVGGGVNGRGLKNVLWFLWTKTWMFV